MAKPKDTPNKSLIDIDREKYDPRARIGRIGMKPSPRTPKTKPLTEYPARTFAVSRRLRRNKYRKMSR